MLGPLVLRVTNQKIMVGWPGLGRWLTEMVALAVGVAEGCLGSVCRRDVGRWCFCDGAREFVAGC